ncbi:alpha/beta hydrolase family esterase [Streptomyces inhibens]|uniref:alpha/beta hydrolase family esterase n=1 Tax=Streptomyces inhibens TaxID=2293571 RepID=UPI001EE6DDE0|nr:PHB depolymerase family esterase [Streptomyces inhibens]UKY48917.1 prolyl oligopeptidase family serine peptidase [Streptomyces inhibens]
MDSFTPSRRGRTVRAWCHALLLGLALAGCGTTTEPPAPPTKAGGSVAPTTAAEPPKQLRVDGRTREYLLHRPAANGSKPRPLIIAFHGRGSTASYLREQSRLDEDARARGMLIAYPEGLHKLWGAGTQVTEQRPDPDLDVRFTKTLIDELVRTERADPERVYVVGFSNGGSMALRVAAQHPELLAGAAAVSGELPTGAAAVKPTGPVPAMIIYGADDPVRPLAGMPSPTPAPAGEEPVTPTMSARDSAGAFAAAGGAGKPATETEAGYDRTVWRLRNPGATVQLLVMHDAGHAWPGSRITPPKGFGRTSTALNATSTILDFFRL